MQLKSVSSSGCTTPSMGGCGHHCYTNQADALNKHYEEGCTSDAGSIHSPLIMQSVHIKVINVNLYNVLHLVYRFLDNKRDNIHCNTALTISLFDDYILNRETLHFAYLTTVPKLDRRTQYCVHPHTV